MKLSRILWFTGLFLMAVNACQREDMSAAQDGEEILFCSNLAGASATKADVDIPDGYTIQVEMYQNGTAAVIGTASYTTSGSTLVAGALRLYWPAESTAEYAFQATAGSNSLEEDQTTLAKLQAQDELLGFAFISGGSDYEDALNYRTRKDWGQADGTNRRVPLYMKHQRSLVTLILKAGEGVRREDLVYGKAVTNLGARIYSYGTETKVIQAYLSPACVDYGVEKDVPTSQFQAIVEPHNYSSQRIADLYLSGQHFSFSWNDDLDVAQNLVITVTLNRGANQEAFLSAQIEDWASPTETTSTVDDFGAQD